MRQKLVLACLVAGSFACVRAPAATLDVAVVDLDGRPAPDAVVTLTPASGTALPSHVSGKAVIDQRHEMFFPLDVVVRRGGEVVFTNNDTTKHQVYSFSPIKQFQFVIAQGETAAPVAFDTPGVAAIGCNIHDQMIAYVFVASDPYAAVSDAGGHAKFSGLADGRYRVSLWHPQLRIGGVESAGTVDVKGGSAELTGRLSVALETASAMKPMHMDY